MADKTNVVVMTDWLKKKEKGPEEATEPKLVPSGAHPDPAVRLSAEMLDLLRSKADSYNTLAMLVALSLTYTSVIKTYECERGTEEADTLLAMADDIVQTYQIVIHGK